MTTSATKPERPDHPENFSGREWLIWQLADSAFPMGGFSHSGGLESVFQHGQVRTGAHLLLFLETALIQSGKGSLPFVSAGFVCPDKFEELDYRLDAFISNHVTNRASRLQGNAFLNAVDQAFGGSGTRDLKNKISEEELPGHWAAIYGVVARLIGLEKFMTLRLFLFFQLRGWISSAVRLGIVGPFEGQRLQARLAGKSEQVLEKCERLSVSEAGQTSPLLDLFQGTQDRLYSRLFQS